jgi:UDP-N-acetylmuramyl pentapeptide synthase
VAVLPAESPYLGLIKQLAQVNARGLRVITFGLECSADVSAQNLRFDERACAHFDMQAIGFWQVPVSLGVPGKHQVYNALCAAACAWALDIDAQTIRDGLQSVVLPGQRLATRQLADGSILIDDAYNANPESVKASLDMLAAYAARSRKVAILGDMLELGPTSAQRHIEVGEQAAALGLDALICVGPAAADIAQGSRSAGMSQVLAFADFDAFKASIDQVRALIDRDTVLLLKASRGMRFEQITDLLTQD